MIETFSKNVSVDSNTPIPLNSVALMKGTSVTKLGSSSLIFNKCGVYKLIATASAAADTVGDISIQVYKDGVAQEQSTANATATDTTSQHNMSICTFISVPKSVSNCPCSVPTRVDIYNTGTPATFDIDVVVSRV